MFKYIFLDICFTLVNISCILKTDYILMLLSCVSVNVYLTKLVCGIDQVYSSLCKLSTCFIETSVEISNCNCEFVYCRVLAVIA